MCVESEEGCVPPSLGPKVRSEVGCGSVVVGEVRIGGGRYQVGGSALYAW